MPEAGRLKFVIEIDDKGTPIIKNINGEVVKLETGVSGSTTKMSKGFGSMWAQMALGQAAFALVQQGFRLITNEIGDSIQMAIDAEETHSKFGTVFRKVAGQAAAAADELSTSWGVSTLASETMLSATGDLLTGLGLESGAALDLSLKTQKLAIDLASFTNYSGGASGASEALTKAMLGERESIKSLGMVITEEMVKEELVRVGKQKLTGMSLLQAKAEATLQIAMKQNANAMGDYARTQDSTANSIKRMKATWEDMKIAIGTAIVEVIGPALKNMKRWFEENKEAIIAGAKDIIKFLADVAGIVSKVVGWFWKHKDAVVAVGIAYATYFAGTKIIAMVAGFESLATAIAASAVAMGPLVIVVTAAAGAFLLLKNHMDKFKDTDKEMAQSAANTTAFVERQAALEKLGVSYSDLNDALKDFGTNSDSMNDKLNMAMESAKKGDPYLTKLAGAFAELEKQEKVAVVATEDVGKATQLVVPPIENLTKKEKTLIEIMNEKWEAFNKLLVQDQAYSDFVMSKLGPAIESYSDTWADNIDVNKMANDAMAEGADIIEKLKPKIEKADKETKKWSLDWNDANEVMGFAKSLMSEVAEGLDALGIDLGDNEEAWLGAAEGAATFIQGCISGNPLTIIASAVGVLTNLIKALSGDGIQEAIDRENTWMGLNETLNSQLHEMADAVGSVHLATSIMLDEIIANSTITLANFDEYAARIEAIISNLDRGELTMAETAAEVGDAFAALLVEAKKLGTEGSASLIKLFDDLKSRGIEVAEIIDYIAEQTRSSYEGYKNLQELMDPSSLRDQMAALKAQMAALHEGGLSKDELEKYKELRTQWDELNSKLKDTYDLQKIFGDLNNDVFDEMIRWEKKVAENPLMENAIDAATQYLLGFSNVMKLTDAQFDQFGDSADKLYDKLLGKGYTQNQALMSMKDYLQRLQYLKEQNLDLSVSPELQQLLDAAIKAGIVQENTEADSDIFKEQRDLLTTINEALGKDIPNLLARLVENTKGEEPTGAAGGFHDWVAPGSFRKFVTGEREAEFVDITPASEMKWYSPKTGNDSPGSNRQSANPGTMNNWYVNMPGTISPENVCDALITGVRRNTHGIRSVLGV